MKGKETLRKTKCVGMGAESAGETRIISVIGGDEKEVYVEALTLNKDNTLTFKVYCYSEKE